MANRKQLRFRARSASAGLFLLSGSLLAWPLLQPAEISVSPRRRLPPPAAVQKRGSELPPLEAFRPIWEIDLRRPLVDPPPPQKPPPPAPRLPPLRLQLVGTVQESGHSMALLANPQGVIEVKRVGELLGEGRAAAEVVAIQAEQVTVRYQNQDIQLRLPENP